MKSSLLLAIALAAGAAHGRSCDWSAPGADPYTGMKSAAVWHYTHIPLPYRAALVFDVWTHQWRDHVRIRKDSISGTYDYDPGIEQMTFGSGRVCSTVSRAGWRPDDEQRALVYCAGPYCVGVASVCGNTFVLRPAVPALVPLPTPVPAWVVPLQGRPARTVDEPPGWAAVLAGLAAMCGAVVFRRWRRRGPLPERRDLFDAAG